MPWLEVILYGGRKLDVVGENSFYPYGCVDWNGESHFTRVARQTFNPTWDAAKFKFKITQDLAAEALTFGAFNCDETGGGNDEFLGQFTLDLPAAFSEWYNNLNSANKLHLSPSVYENWITLEGGVNPAAAVRMRAVLHPTDDGFDSFVASDQGVGDDDYIDDGLTEVPATTARSSRAPLSSSMTPTDSRRTSLRSVASGGVERSLSRISSMHVPVRELPNAVQDLAQVIPRRRRSSLISMTKNTLPPRRTPAGPLGKFCLEVEILEARDLRPRAAEVATRLGPFPNAYCFVQQGDQVFTTSANERSLNPKWIDEPPIRLMKDDLEEHVPIFIRDFDPVLNDDAGGLGIAFLDCCYLKPNERCEQWINIKGGRGSLLVAATLHGDHAALSSQLARLRRARGVTDPTPQKARPEKPAVDLRAVLSDVLSARLPSASQELVDKAVEEVLPLASEANLPMVTTQGYQILQRLWRKHLEDRLKRELVEACPDLAAALLQRAVATVVPFSPQPDENEFQLKKDEALQFIQNAGRIAELESRLKNELATEHPLASPESVEEAAQLVLPLKSTDDDEFNRKLTAARAALVQSLTDAIVQDLTDHLHHSHPEADHGDIESAVNAVLPFNAPFTEERLAGWRNRAVENLQMLFDASSKTKFSDLESRLRQSLLERHPDVSQKLVHDVLIGLPPAAAHESFESRIALADSRLLEALELRSKQQDAEKATALATQLRQGLQRGVPQATDELVEKAFRQVENLLTTEGLAHAVAAGVQVLQQLWLDAVAQRLRHEILAEELTVSPELVDEEIGKSLLTAAAVIDEKSYQAKKKGIVDRLRNAAVTKKWESQLREELAEQYPLASPGVIAQVIQSVLPFSSADESEYERKMAQARAAVVDSLRQALREQLISQLKERHPDASQDELVAAVDALQPLEAPFTQDCKDEWLTQADNNLSALQATTKQTKLRNLKFNLRQALQEQFPDVTHNDMKQILNQLPEMTDPDAYEEYTQLAEKSVLDYIESRMIGELSEKAAAQLGELREGICQSVPHAPVELVDEAVEAAKPLLQTSGLAPAMAAGIQTAQELWKDALTKRLTSELADEFPGLLTEAIDQTTAGISPFSAKTDEAGYQQRKQLAAAQLREVAQMQDLESRLRSELAAECLLADESQLAEAAKLVLPFRRGDPSEYKRKFGAARAALVNAIKASFRDSLVDELQRRRPSAKREDLQAATDALPPLESRPLTQEAFEIWLTEADSIYAEQRRMAANTKASEDETRLRESLYRRHPDIPQKLVVDVLRRLSVDNSGRQTSLEEKLALAEKALLQNIESRMIGELQERRAEQIGHLREAVQLGAPGAPQDLVEPAIKRVQPLIASDRIALATTGGVQSIRSAGAADLERRLRNSLAQQEPTASQDMVDVAVTSVLPLDEDEVSLEEKTVKALENLRQSVHLHNLESRLRDDLVKTKGAVVDSAEVDNAVASVLPFKLGTEQEYRRKLSAAQRLLHPVSSNRRPSRVAASDIEALRQALVGAVPSASPESVRNIVHRVRPIIAQDGLPAAVAVGIGQLRAGQAAGTLVTTESRRSFADSTVSSFSPDVYGRRRSGVRDKVAGNSEEKLSVPVAGRRMAEQRVPRITAIEQPLSTDNSSRRDFAQPASVPATASIQRVNGEIRAKNLQPPESSCAPPRVSGGSVGLKSSSAGTSPSSATKRTKETRYVNGIDEEVRRRPLPLIAEIPDDYNTYRTTQSASVSSMPGRPSVVSLVSESSMGPSSAPVRGDATRPVVDRPPPFSSETQNNMERRSNREKVYRLASIASSSSSSTAGLTPAGQVVYSHSDHIDPHSRGSLTPEHPSRASQIYRESRSLSPESPTQPKRRDYITYHGNQPSQYMSGRGQEARSPLQTKTHNPHSPTTSPFATPQSYPDSRSGQIHIHHTVKTVYRRPY